MIRGPERLSSATTSFPVPLLSTARRPRKAPQMESVVAVKATPPPPSLLLPPNPPSPLPLPSLPRPLLLLLNPVPSSVVARRAQFPCLLTDLSRTVRRPLVPKAILVNQDNVVLRRISPVASPASRERCVPRPLLLSLDGTSTTKWLTVDPSNSEAAIQMQIISLTRLPVKPSVPTALLEVPSFSSQEHLSVVVCPAPYINANEVPQICSPVFDSCAGMSSSSSLILPAGDKCVKTMGGLYICCSIPSVTSLRSLIAQMCGIGWKPWVFSLFSSLS